MGNGKGRHPEDPHWLGEGINVYLDHGMVVLEEEREGESLRRIHLHDDELKNLVRWLKSVERAKAKMKE